jgi:exosortase
VALYSHANLRVPAAADRAIALVLVTPRVHAVHHSNVRAETDSNFGSVLTVWDRLFGTYVEPARARVPHIGLDYFHHAADTRWWRVLLQPFLYAPGRAYPPRGAHRTNPRRSRAAAAPFAAGREARIILVIGLAACALVLATLWPTAADMARIWRDTEAWQYAWLVLPMLVYLLAWHRGAAWAPVQPQPGLAGAIVAGVAALLFAAASLVNIDAGRQLALVLMLQGVALATLGWSAYVRLFPALALLFFAVPYGDILVPALRRLTLESIVLVTTLAGVPHTIDGYVVLVGTRRYIVVDECAGLSYVTLAAFLGYCFALLMHRSFVRAAGMALAGACLGILSNVIRVNAIVLVDWIRGSQMDLTAHGTAQWIMLLVVLGALMFMLARSRVLDERPAAGYLTRRHAVWLLWSPALAAAMAPLAVGMLAVLAMHDRLPVSALAAGAFPADLSGWTRVAPPQRTELPASTRAQMMHASYRQDARTLDLVLVEALDQDAKLPEAPLAPGAHAVWREKQVKSETACAGADCVAVRHATWQRESSPAVRHVYLVYGVGAFTSDSRLTARMAQGWRRLHGDDRTARVVAISTDLPLAADELARAMLDVRTAIAGAAGLQVAGAR